MDDEINIIDYLKIINKRKWIIILCVVIAVMFSFFQTISAKKMYKAEVTMLSLNSSIGGLTQALSSIPFTGGGGAIGSLNNIEFILKSKTLARQIAQHSDFKKIIFKQYWDSKNNVWKGKEPTIYDTAAALQGSIKSGSESKIEVIWDDPETAAIVANAYAKALIMFLNQKAININLQIMDEAEPQYTPYNKKTSINVVIGVVMGLFAGLFTIVIAECWDKLKANL